MVCDSKKRGVATMIVALPSMVLPTMIDRASADDLGAIAGKWAFEGTSCNVKPDVADNFLIISRSGKNERHETFCQASSVRSGASQIEFQNTCMSEGEQSKGKTVVKIVSPDRIAWKEGRQSAINYLRCGSGKAGSPNDSGSSNAAQSFEAGSFSLSSHGYSATITALTGPDTSDARMTGKVTRADAEEECERNSPGGEGLKPKALQKCVAGTMAKENSKEYVATANCQNRTVHPHFGETFRISGVDSTGIARILDSRKQDIGSATASGAPSIQDQFEKLCPATFRRLKRS